MSQWEQYEAAGLLVEVVDGIATLTLNRQDRLNSISGDLAVALREAVLALDADKSVRVGIITGAGERSFCVGADLKDENGDAQHDKIGGWGGLTRLPFQTPFIAAVNGMAVGGGLEIALSCDFIYASNTARFGFTEVAIGVVAGAGGLFRFPRVVGSAFALEYMLTGTLFPAEKALEIGLVNAIVEPTELMATVREVARNISKNSPASIRFTRQVIKDSLGKNDQECWAISDAVSEQVLNSPDHVEGIAAFVEKRPPVWTS